MVTYSYDAIDCRDSAALRSSLAELAVAARGHLESEILPFWVGKGIDTERGGFFTCFDNRGRDLLSTDKYTWSQGRFVSVLARAAQAVQEGRLTGDAGLLLDASRRGAQFLTDHAVREDDSCHYVLDREGRLPPDEGSSPRSVYADCFVAMGLAELAGVSGEDGWLEPANRIADQATKAVESGHPATTPYELPPGASGYGPLMILLNTRLDLLRAHRALGVTGDGRAALARCRDDVVSRRRDDGNFDEVVVAVNHDQDTLIARHQTPGHALEGLWMIAEANRILGDGVLEPLLDSADAICRKGWDVQHGGLFRYVDADGGAPRGRKLGGDYERLVERTWATKLWWVHSEAVYAMALLGGLSGDERLHAWRDRLWQYTASTFPGGADGEEWVQIRDRFGDPLDEVVSLPLKDPYHVTRNLLQLLDLAAAEGD